MHRRWKVWAAALAVGAVTVTGCAAGAEDTGERTYVEVIIDDPVHLNPQLVQDPVVERLGATMLEGLVRLSPEFEVIPWLAEDWEVEEDGKSLTLNLRKSVTWHDGEPFDAEDVRFNIEEIFPLQPNGAGLAAAIETIETPDDHTVILHLSTSYGPLFEALSTQFLLPEHLYSGTDYLTNPANNEPVGTGPLIFDSYTSGEEVVLVGNPDYWGGEVPVDRAIFPIITDLNARTVALFDGQVDMSWAYVDTSQRSRIESDPNLEIVDSDVIAQQLLLFMNTEREILSDPAVRALVYSAIDRGQVIDLALKGLADEPTSALPTTVEWALNPEVDYRETFPRDIEEIKDGLDEAGYPEGSDGSRFTLDLRFMSTVGVLSPSADIIKSSLADVGINVNLIGEDIAVIVDKVYTARDYDLGLFATNVSTDPSLGVTRWYTCNDEKAPHRNPTGVCDPALDAAADGALYGADRDARATNFRLLQERAEELLPAAPIAFMKNFSAYNNTRWEGLGDVAFLREWVDWVNLEPVS